MYVSLVTAFLFYSESAARKLPMSPPVAGLRAQRMVSVGCRGWVFSFIPQEEKMSSMTAQRH